MPRLLLWKRDRVFHLLLPGKFIEFNINHVKKIFIDNYDIIF